MMIELQNISKHYTIGNNDIAAIKQIDLSLKQGDFTALVGPSGCGKSSTMAIIGLLDHPTSGRYLLEGKDTSLLSRNKLAHLRNHTFGFIFQSFCLLPRLSALENVGLPLIYRGLPSREIKERALASMARMNIAHLAPHKPNEMSGGQQQRVAVARALVGNPRIILADEPTGALDSKTGQRLMESLIALNQQHNVTILLVTHDSHVAEQCKKTLYMKDGEFVSAASAR